MAWLSGYVFQELTQCLLTSLGYCRSVSETGAIDRSDNRGCMIANDCLRLSSSSHETGVRTSRDIRGLSG